MKFQYVYTRLYVEDCRACYKFYHDVLGLEATFISDIDTYVELTDGKVKLTLLNQNKLIEYLGNKAQFRFESKSDRLSLSFEVNDVEQACKHLQEQGIEMVSPPMNIPDWGVKLALVRDPEGNLIELTQMGEMVGAE